MSTSTDLTSVNLVQAYFALTSNKNKNKNVQQINAGIKNSGTVISCKNEVTSKKALPVQQNHISGNNPALSKKGKPQPDQSFAATSSNKNTKIFTASSKKSPFVGCNPSKSVVIKDSNLRKAKDDFSISNGEHLKSLKNIKSVLSSGKMFDFPDTILSILVEIHEMTSIASLMLENKKVKKTLNLSDEIYLMSLQSSFKLADLKLDSFDPLYHSELVTFVASLKEQAKYLSVRKNASKDNFLCKVCCISLDINDVKSHLRGARHQNKIIEINKFINLGRSNIIDEMLMNLPSSKSSSSCVPLLKNIDAGNPPNPSSFDGKTSKNSNATQNSLSVELSPTMLSLFFCMSPSNKSDSWCVVCNVNVAGPRCVTNTNLVEHVKGAKHRSLSLEISPKMLSLSFCASPSNESDSWCLICKVNVPGPRCVTNTNLVEHVKGAKHRSKLAPPEPNLQNAVTPGTKTSLQNVSDDRTKTSSQKVSDDRMKTSLQNVSDDRTKTSSQNVSDDGTKTSLQNVSDDILTGSNAASKPLSGIYFQLMSSVMKKHVMGAVPVDYGSDVVILGYYCDLCTEVIVTDAEWLLHLDNFAHKLNVVHASTNTGHYHCLICKIVIFCPLVPSTTSHSHIFSNEHRYIKKLVEKQCPDIAKYVQKYKVLTIKANNLSCNSLSLNLTEEFPVCQNENSSAESAFNVNCSRVQNPKWSLKELPQKPDSDRTAKKMNEKSINIFGSDDDSEDSNNDDDFDDYSQDEFDDDNFNDGDDDATDVSEDFERKLSVSVESGTKDEGKNDVKEIDQMLKTNNSHSISVGKKINGKMDKPPASVEQSQANKKQSARVRKENSGYSVIFKGIDDSVSAEEWINRFKEAGRLKDITLDYINGTATVVYCKKSSFRKVFTDRNLILNKYKLQAVETAKENLDLKCLELFEDEHEFMNKILSTLNVIDDELNSSESKLRLACLKETVLHSIRFAFPDCKIYEFGSRVSGLATEESDYDLFLDLTGTMYLGTKPAVDHETRVEMLKAIGKIATIFRQIPTEFTSIVPITSARVPILKFKHIKTNSQCDLSFKNGLSIENTKLVRKYLNMNTKVRWLVVAVKRWAKTCGLLSSSHFTTYAITWLVLFFLMSKNLVPPVGSFMKNQKKNKKPPIQGWRCNFDEASCQCKLKDSNVQLLLNFFDFYQSYDFRKFVLCTRSGTSVRKFVLLEKVSSMLPVEIRDDYCNSVAKSDKERDFSVGTCSVQDPFDLSHNITKQVRPGVLKCFQRCCQLAVSQMRKWPPFQV